MRVECDYLVLGSGVAGLSFALEAARYGRVTMVTKRSRTDSATNWAQGGIAAVLDPADSFEAHVDDTMGTGGGLSHRDIVEMVVRDGPDRIRELILDRRPASEVKRAAQEEGMVFLRESALEKVFKGVTTLREINKVTFVA